MTTRTYGSKYDSNLRGKDIAKLIRQDIKAAVKSGELPNLKVSVRTERCTHETAIEVEVVGLPEGFQIFSDRYLHLRREGSFPSIEWSKQAKDVVAKLSAIRAAYNYNGSDIMTDYYDYNFLGMVTFDPELQFAELGSKGQRYEV